MGLERDIREDFIDALRERRYPQTWERLRDDDEFCAIGVLCDIHPDLQWARHGSVDGVWSIEDKGAAAAGVARTTSATGLPESFTRRLGINDEDVGRIVELNDGIVQMTIDEHTGDIVSEEHLSFPEIARRIKSEGLLA